MTVDHIADNVIRLCQEDDIDAALDLLYESIDNRKISHQYEIVELIDLLIVLMSVRNISKFNSICILLSLLTSTNWKDLFFPFEPTVELRTARNRCLEEIRLLDSERYDRLVMGLTNEEIDNYKW